MAKEITKTTGRRVWLVARREDAGLVFSVRDAGAGFDEI
jgi:C4-dicarboxylate-specific signal transduction histidine kinase